MSASVPIETIDNHSAITEQNVSSDSHAVNWARPYDPSAICRFFLSGNCRFGENCRYLHVIEDQQENSAHYDELVPGAPYTNKTHRDNSFGHQDAYTNRELIEPAASSNLRNWIDAPEFIPRFTAHKIGEPNNNEYDVNDALHNHENDADSTVPNTTISYAQIVGDNANCKISYRYDAVDAPIFDPMVAATICPYFNQSIDDDGNVYCPYGERCGYLHGDLCTICNSYCLHPTDENQRKAHETECMKLLEQDMEHSFAVARSKDKTCGICFEVITEKVNREHRFGILPNCQHIFCLQCIRKWRQAKNFDSTITRSCPECRITSNYVVPSLYWVDTKEEKEKLLNEYKQALNKQNCKYFKEGTGNCPFGNKCFYRHALANGELVDVGVPRRRLDLNGESDLFGHINLSIFLDARDQSGDYSSFDEYEYYYDSDSD